MKKRAMIAWRVFAPNSAPPVPSETNDSGQVLAQSPNPHGQSCHTGFGGNYRLLSPRARSSSGPHTRLLIAAAPLPEVSGYRFGRCGVNEEGTSCRERPRGPEPISRWWNFHMRENLIAPRLESPMNLWALFRRFHESVYRNLKGLDQRIYLHS
jgi:hypothetical protein